MVLFSVTILWTLVDGNGKFCGYYENTVVLYSCENHTCKYNTSINVARTIPSYYNGLKCF